MQTQFIKGTLYSVALSLVGGGVWATVDPTRPLNYQEPVGTVKQGEETDLRLTAIFRFSNKIVAIISGNVCQVGDKVLNNAVTKIEKKTVTLSGPDGREIVLKLMDFSVKKDAP